VSRGAAVRVRQASPGDLAVVIDLRLALLREYADHPVYGRLREDAPVRARPLYRAQLSSRDQAIFLAEDDAQALGIIRCVDSAGSPLLDPARYCYISSAYVSPPHRQRGVLRLLLRAVERWAEQRGLAELRLHDIPASSSADGAWSALGFTIVEQLRVRAL
jgi:GNAT superfamily N-acetyltransferase